MALRTFRVRKEFDWNGVRLFPGDIWLVDMAGKRAGRVQTLLDNRFAMGDATLPSGKEAAGDPELALQLSIVGGRT